MPKPISLSVPPNEVTPDPALEKPSRRSFSLPYKLRILAEAEHCRHGELGALLRREKLYSSQISGWRKQLAAGDEKGLAKTTPGPAPLKSAEQKQIEKLQAKLARTERQLQIAEGCIDLQKKLALMLEQASSNNDA